VSLSYPFAAVAGIQLLKGIGDVSVNVETVFQESLRLFDHAHRVCRISDQALYLRCEFIRFHCDARMSRRPQTRSMETTRRADDSITVTCGFYDFYLDACIMSSWIDEQPTFAVQVLGVFRVRKEIEIAPTSILGCPLLLRSSNSSRNNEPLALQTPN